MTAYELMIKANHYLIKGGELSESQKINVTRSLLNAKNNEKTINNFKKGINAPEYLHACNQSNDRRIMYPLFYIPPYNDGKKLQTVIPMAPKTHILAANSYELEIIRLLYFFAPVNPIIQDMTNKTLARLQTTCFAYQDCHHGECFHSALITLRFIASVSNDIVWMKKLVSFFNKYNGETYRHSGTFWYYCLCLSELPFEIAEPEIRKYKNKLLNQLSKNFPMNSEKDKLYNPIFYFVMRNCLCRLPEFTYIKNRQPYLDEKNGRLYFNMNA